MKSVTHYILTLLLAVFGITSSTPTENLHNATREDYVRMQTLRPNSVFPSITITDGATNIYTHSYLGFDTNHHYLWYRFPPSDLPPLQKIITTTLAPHWADDPTFIVVTNAYVTNESFEQIFFTHLCAPQWWPTNFSRFGTAAYCAMYSTNDYGRGTMFLVDDENYELFFITWSQQWCDTSRLQRAFPSTTTEVALPQQLLTPATSTDFSKGRIYFLIPLLPVLCLLLFFFSKYTHLALHIRIALLAVVTLLPLINTWLYFLYMHHDSSDNTLQLHVGLGSAILYVGFLFIPIAIYNIKTLIFTPQRETNNRLHPTRGS